MTMSDELKPTGSIMIESLTDYGEFPDSGGGSEELQYNYYPYFLADLLYQADVTGYVNQEELVIHPFKTVYEESFVTSAGELMFTR